MSATTSQSSFRPQSSPPGVPGRTQQKVARLLEQLPPHAIEAEMCLLGSILIEPGVLGDVALIIRQGEEFYKPANGAIYDAMVELYDKHASIDVVQLHQVLVDRDILESVGGQEYLVELASSVPSAHNAEHYARLVREKAIVRRLIEQAGQILQDAYTSRDDASTMLDSAEHRIFSIAEHYESHDVEVLQRLIDQYVEDYQSREGRPVSGLRTGFGGLDELTGGLQPGEFVIIAARPSMGKTAIALNMAAEMAIGGHPVGIFSLEMSKRHLVERLAASKSGVDLQRIRRMNLRSDQWERLQTAFDKLRDACILVDDLASATSLQIRARARRMVAKHAIKAIFVDYIQLVTVGGRTESRQLEVSEISRGFKALARELEIPVVALSQLNRSPEQRETHRPRLSDLRESGSLEQDADVVCLLHREEYYHQGEDDWPERNPEKVGKAELIIAKQRNGPTGIVNLTWDQNSTTFKDYSPRDAPGEYVQAKPESSMASAAYIDDADNIPI